MFCSNCEKLAALPSSNKKCLKCTGNLQNNISVICDNCSNNDNVCSCCLKKIGKQANNFSKSFSCTSCGKK